MALKKKSSKKLRALILTADLFEDLEFFYPYFRLLEEGAEVDVAGPKKERVHGEHGYVFEINLAFDDVKSENYDLLILPGGTPDGAPSAVRKSLKAQSIARDFFAAGKPVGAICHGPYTLISAGLLKGKKATSFWGDGVPEEIEKSGGKYEDKEVVVDGNLVTSRYPWDIPSFMREVMKLVSKNR